MRRVELPQGAWAQILEGFEVPEGKARLIDAARMRMFKASDVDISEVDPSQSEQEQAEKMKAKISAAQAAASLEFMPDLRDATILAHVVEWSFGDKVDAETLLNVPRIVYVALHDECAKESVHLENQGPEGAADPESPTEPLAESDN